MSTRIVVNRLWRLERIDGRWHVQTRCSFGSRFPTDRFQTCDYVDARRRYALAIYDNLDAARRALEWFMSKAQSFDPMDHFDYALASYHSNQRDVALAFERYARDAQSAASVAHGSDEELESEAMSIGEDEET